VTKFEIDGRRFASADDAIRYLVAEHTKKELVDLLLATLSLPEQPALDVERLADALWKALPTRYRQPWTIPSKDAAAIAAEYARLTSPITADR